MWQCLTELAKRKMRSAEYIASQRGENIVTPEHLLLALLREDAPKYLTYILLMGLRDKPETIAGKVEAGLPMGIGRLETRLQADPRFKDLIACATAEAKKLRCQFVAPDHLFLALLSDKGLAGSTLRKYSPVVSVARERLDMVYIARAAAEASIEASAPPRSAGIYEWYTAAAKQAIACAQAEAEQLGQHFVEPEHLLAGVLQKEDSAATRLLSELGMERNDIREGLSSLLEEGLGLLEGSDRELSPRSKQVIDETHRQMQLCGDRHIGTEHLLLGLLSDTGPAGALLAGSLCSRQAPSRSVAMVLKQISRGPVVEGGTTLKPIAKGVRGDKSHAVRWFDSFLGH